MGKYSFLLVGLVMPGNEQKGTLSMLLRTGQMIRRCPPRLQLQTWKSRSDYIKLEIELIK